jgi:hypothetical protein
VIVPKDIMPGDSRQVEIEDHKTWTASGLSELK